MKARNCGIRGCRWRHWRRRRAAVKRWQAGFRRQPQVVRRVRWDRLVLLMLPLAAALVFAGLVLAHPGPEPHRSAAWAMPGRWAWAPPEAASTPPSTVSTPSNTPHSSIYTPPNTPPSTVSTPSNTRPSPPASAAAAAPLPPGRAPLTEAQVRDLAAEYGLLPLDEAVCVARAESSFRPWIVSPTHDYGLWQINRRTWKRHFEAAGLWQDWEDPSVNTQMAAHILRVQGWGAWAVHRDTRIEGARPKCG